VIAQTATFDGTSSFASVVKFWTVRVRSFKSVAGVVSTAAASAIRADPSLVAASPLVVVLPII